MVCRSDISDLSDLSDLSDKSDKSDKSEESDESDGSNRNRARRTWPRWTNSRLTCHVTRITPVRSTRHGPRHHVSPLTFHLRPEPEPERPTIHHISTCLVGSRAGASAGARGRANAGSAEAVGNDRGKHASPQAFSIAIAIAIPIAIATPFRFRCRYRWFARWLARAIVPGCPLFPSLFRRSSLIFIRRCSDPCHGPCTGLAGRARHGVSLHRESTRIRKQTPTTSGLRPVRATTRRWMRTTHASGSTVQLFARSRTPGLDPVRRRPRGGTLPVPKRPSAALCPGELGTGLQLPELVPGGLPGRPGGYHRHCPPLRTHDVQGHHPPSRG